MLPVFIYVCTLYKKKKKKKHYKMGTVFTSSPPPLELVAVFAIISLFLFLSSYPNYKYKVEKTTTNLKILLLFLPILFVFLLVSMSFFRGVFFGSSYSVRANQAMSLFGESKFPWGVLVMLIILLFLVSKQSYFHSLWYTIF
ncbi:unnamed protein product [Cochlearia groenlandica]